MTVAVPEVMSCTVFRTWKAGADAMSVWVGLAVPVMDGSSLSCVGNRGEPICAWFRTREPLLITGARVTWNSNDQRVARLALGSDAQIADTHQTRAFGPARRRGQRGVRACRNGKELQGARREHGGRIQLVEIVGQREVRRAQRADVLNSERVLQRVAGPGAGAGLAGGHIVGGLGEGQEWRLGGQRERILVIQYAGCAVGQLDR